jgi:urea transport system ATP-binding protein
MLTVDAVDVFYGRSRALNRVTVSAGDGQVVCVMGRNGVGKTTLLKTMMGVLTPRAGRVHFAGRDVTELAPYERARMGMAYVPQGREIFPALTVRENLVVGSRHKRPPRTSLDYVFDLFPALPRMLGKRGGDLSGGQQQQLALARALIADPRLLLLDEPTEGIQPSIVEEIADALSRIKAEGRRTMVVVEQYLEFARALCDRFYIMEKGAIAWEAEGTGFDVEHVKRFLSV